MKFFDLSGQTALVTGAARGIGAVIASRLARAGAHVAVGDLDLAEAEKIAVAVAADTGTDVFAVHIDVSRPESVGDAVATVLSRRGQIDILVNNAGIAGMTAPVWEQTDEAWRGVYDVNIHGVFHCTRAVIPHMLQRKYGRIVNIASVAGKEGNPKMTGYSSTKAAVIGFTKAVGKEVAEDGICVNAVSPAVVRTPILDQISQAQIDYMTSRIPMRRTGEPEEIAAVVHFLSSPDCSFVTAQCYDASGGRSTY